GVRRAAAQRRRTVTERERRLIEQVERSRARLGASADALDAQLHELIGAFADVKRASLGGFTVGVGLSALTGLVLELVRPRSRARAEGAGRMGPIASWLLPLLPAIVPWIVARLTPRPKP
ncbi:MAG TPA: hypothetical protein VJS92_05015, partial [Candidatus Polarisedimenticolaceae bacterium]|nr:hypothetical protein [Candidatus Polarisedimenticolaceae bacterium]